jgi:hypothetical protein
MGIPVLDGRDFSFEDGAARPNARVAILNRSLAERLFRGEEAVGNQVIIGREESFDGKVTAEIIGVVGDTRHDGASLEQRRQVYLPYGPHGIAPVFLHATLAGNRADADSAAGVARDITRAVQSAVPGAPVLAVQPLSAWVERDFGTFSLRVGAGVATTLAALALFLTVVGIYGLKSYSVGRRTREIAIRMALGTPSRQLIRMLLRQTLVQLALGLALGVALTVLARRALEAVTIETGTGDLQFIITSALFILVAAALAVWKPLVQAARVSPTLALQRD